MIYHHDDADEDLQRQADGGDEIGKMSERLMYIFAACILVPLVLHMLAKYWGAL